MGAGSLFLAPFVIGQNRPTYHLSGDYIMCFRLGRIRIKISFLFFAMLTLIFALDKRTVALVTVVSVALHEMGHIAALLGMGLYPDEICFGIFGIRIRNCDYRLDYRRELVAVMCGPLVNVALTVASLVLYKMLAKDAFMVIFAVNFSVAVFNLLPILPLDGGRLLHLMLMKIMSCGSAQRTMTVVSTVTALVVLLAGVLLAVRTGANISLLATGLYLGIISIKSIKI